MNNCRTVACYLKSGRVEDFLAGNLSLTVAKDVDLKNDVDWKKSQKEKIHQIRLSRLPPKPPTPPKIEYAYPTLSVFMYDYTHKTKILKMYKEYKENQDETLAKKIELLESELRKLFVKLLIEAVEKIMQLHEAGTVFQNFFNPCLFVNSSQDEIHIVLDDTHEVGSPDNIMGSDLYILIRDFAMAAETAQYISVSNVDDNDSLFTYPFDGFDDMFSLWYNSIYRNEPTHIKASTEHKKLYFHRDILNIGLSPLQDAGRGVFTNGSIEKDTILFPYEGTSCSMADYIWYSKHSIDDYAQFFRKKDGMYVSEFEEGEKFVTNPLGFDLFNGLFDSFRRDNFNFSAYMNDGKGFMNYALRKENNCAFTDDRNIVSIKDIDVGPRSELELLVGYGERFWARKTNWHGYTNADKNELAKVPDIDVITQLRQFEQALDEQPNVVVEDNRYSNIESSQESLEEVPFIDQKTFGKENFSAITRSNLLTNSTMQFPESQNSQLSTLSNASSLSTLRFRHIKLCMQVFVPIDINFTATNCSWTEFLQQLALEWENGPDQFDKTHGLQVQLNTILVRILQEFTQSKKSYSFEDLKVSIKDRNLIMLDIYENAKPKSFEAIDVFSDFVNSLDFKNDSIIDKAHDLFDEYFKFCLKFKPVSIIDFLQKKLDNTDGSAKLKVHEIEVSSNEELSIKLSEFKEACDVLRITCTFPKEDDDKSSDKEKKKEKKGKKEGKKEEKKKEKKQPVETEQNCATILGNFIATKNDQQPLRGIIVTGCQFDRSEITHLVESIEKSDLINFKLVGAKMQSAASRLENAIGKNRNDLIKRLSKQINMMKKIKHQKGKKAVEVEYPIRDEIKLCKRIDNYDKQYDILYTTRDKWNLAPAEKDAISDLLASLR